MSQRFAVPLAAVCLALTFAIPSSCPAEPWVVAPGEYSTEFFGVHVGNGGHLFDDNGDVFDVQRIEERREIGVFNELGWKKRASFLLGASVRSVTLRFDPPPGVAGTPFHRSQTGLADMITGFRFRILDGSTALSLQTAWKIPMGYEREVGVPIGDGLHHFSARLEGGTSLPMIQGFAQASLGYLTRVDLHLNPMKDTHPVGSPLMLYGADVGVWMGDVLVAGRYAGFSSSAQDGSGDDIASHTVGPELRYAVDPRMAVVAGATFDIKGRNSWKTNTYYLGLTLTQTRLHRLQGFLGSGRRP
jgi:hypothetical protein